MGTLDTVKIPTVKSRAEECVSPFFSRSYGGYSESQCAYIREQLGDVRGINILDPMSGQGFFLSQLAMDGANVCLSDLNSGPLLLAGLRETLI
jgi:2-polyprenyl-3-methyl-5-hydroxy-6-metoxy-1,4-benzoquinol methylase